MGLLEDSPLPVRFGNCVYAANQFGVESFIVTSMTFPEKQHMASPSPLSCDRF